MTVLSARITIHIPWAASLKDKRQVRRSLTDKARQRFNISIAEVDTQDMHQTLTLGLAVVSGERHHAQELMDETVRFIESSTDAEVVSVETME